MTYETLLLIFWIIIGLLICFALGGIGWYIYTIGQKSLKEDFTKAIIFTRFGQHWIDPLPAKLFEQTDKSITYQFEKNNLLIVPIDKNNPPEYRKGKRLIFYDGDKSSLIHPIPKDKDVKELSTNDKKDNKPSFIRNFVFSNIGENAINAIKKPKSVAINMILLIIAFAIGAIITFALLKFQPSMLGLQQQTQQSQQQTQQSQQIIPAK